MFTRLIGFCGVVTCLGVVYVFEAHATFTGWMRVFHWPAMVLTGLGPISLLFVCFDFLTVLRMFWVGLIGSHRRLRRRARREAMYLHHLGKSFYDQGPGAFETAKTKGLSVFVLRIIDRLAVRMPNADIQELAHIERDQKEQDICELISVAGMAVRLTPSIGMLGTIMGMVSLLANLEDASTIGASMSLALLTTFYGLFFSIVIWTPIQQKLEKIYEVDMDLCDQALRWLDFIERRKPSNYFAETSSVPKPKGKKSAA